MEEVSAANCSPLNQVCGLRLHDLTGQEDRAFSAKGVVRENLSDRGTGIQQDEKEPELA